MSPVIPNEIFNRSVNCFILVNFWLWSAFRTWLRNLPRSKITTFVSSWGETAFRISRHSLINCVMDLLYLSNKGTAQKTLWSVGCRIYVGSTDMSFSNKGKYLGGLSFHAGQSNRVGFGEGRVWFRADFVLLDIVQIAF